MIIRRGRRLGVVLLGTASTATVLAALLTGCTSGGESVGTQLLTTATAVGPCVDQDSSPDPAARPLRATDRPTAAMACEFTTEKVPGDGEYGVVIHTRATGIDALVAALRLPSQPRTTGDCTMELPLPIQVLLEIDGTPVVIGPLPVDGCGKTRREVRDAYHALPWRETSRSRGAKVSTALTASVGCPTPRKDEFELGGLKTPAADAAPALPQTAVVQAICVYTTTYPDAWKPGDVVDGTGLGGTAITEKQSRQILDLLKNGVPAAPCAQRHTRFAVVVTGDSRELAVELDGCRRILTDTYELRQGSPELVAALSVTP